MKWYQNSWEDFDRETQTALQKAWLRIILPFQVVLVAGIVLAVRYSRQHDQIRFKAREIPAIVSRKYIEANPALRTIRLLYGEEELSFPGSRLYYDSLQVGGSLYKPAGSTYFYLVERPNGVRTLRRLLNDSL